MDTAQQQKLRYAERRAGKKIFQDVIEGLCFINLSAVISFAQSSVTVWLLT